MSVKPAARLATLHWVCGAISPLVGEETLRASLPRTQAEWNYVVSIASAHLILPGLYLAMRDKGMFNLIPAELSEALEGVFTLNVMHNTRLRRQMLSVSGILNRAGISPIWLKGATNLLAPDWENSGRMMLDLDFWVPGAEAQVTALACLEEAGYLMREESEGQDYTKSQHFAPRVKEGEPARIEIHRTIVSPYAAALLPDNEALQNTEWLIWEDVHVGRLAASDRLMHSYIQCTEMNDLSRGRIPLMKVLDFLQRSVESGLPTLPPAFPEKLNRPPWQSNADQFFTFLARDFGMPQLLEYDTRFVRRMDLRIRFPLTMHSFFILNKVCQKIRSGQAGSPRHWWTRFDRFMMSLRKSEPGL